MTNRLKIILLAAFIAIPGSLAADAFPPAGEKLNLDHKFHDVGRVWQVITNLGYLGFHCFTTYAPTKRLEFPVGSGSSYLYTGSLLFAGIRDGQKLFSMADAWSENSPNCAYEFFPSDAPWDSVWVVRGGETVDIGDPKDPYLRKFTPLGDQALVCKYTDFQIRPQDQVAPLFLEVIQISHAWASAPFDEWIVFEYYVIPKRDPIEDLYVAQWIGAALIPPVGSGQGADNLVYYDADRHMGVVEDLPGSDDDDIAGPIGYIMFPPENIDPGTLTWTFNNTIMTDHFDDVQYNLMSAGTIDPPNTNGDGGDRGFFRLSMGPFDLAAGDTLHFFIGEILADGRGSKERAKLNLLANADRMINLKANKFQTPKPPPQPKFRVFTDNHSVTLNWEIQPGGVNPETYQDTLRSDGIDQPFEGYRVYKSTLALNGPWTLLKEVDISDNEFNSNTGLEYEYTDVGLVNNLEYFYSVTAFSKPDTVSRFPSQESGIIANAVTVTPGPAPPPTVGRAAVVPNPYRGDVRYQDFNPPWERPGQGRGRWTEQDRKIQFINIPSPAEIKIYTLAGDLVDTIKHDNPRKGFADWDLLSSVGQAIASGIYLFTVKDERTGEVQVGKFVIIK